MLCMSLCVVYESVLCMSLCVVYVMCMSLCVVYELCNVLGSRGAGDMWPAQDGQEEPDWVRLCVCV